MEALDINNLHNRSWIHLPAQADSFSLSSAGLDNTVDCGWVEQMLPFIEAYSAVGDTVLDPFCGWGTTLLAAGQLQRRGVGVEIEAARVEAIRQRLAFYGLAELTSVHHGDSRQLPLQDASIDIALTSVPYYGPWQDTNWQTDAHAAGQCYRQMDYDAFLAIMNDVFADVARVLKPGAYFIAMAENLRIGDQFVPLAWDCGRLLQKHFVMGDERIITYPKASDSNPAGLKSNRSHEYALIGQKPR